MLGSEKAETTNGCPSISQRVLDIYSTFTQQNEKGDVLHTMKHATKELSHLHFIFVFTS